MAIKVEAYENRVQPRNYTQSQAWEQGAPLRVDDSNAQMLSGIVSDAAKIGMAYEKQKKEQQVATDLVDAEIGFNKEMYEFEEEYKKTNTRAKARSAVADYEKKSVELFGKYEARFADHPEGRLLWHKSAAQMRQSSVNRAAAYAEREDGVYRQETSDALIASYGQKVAAQHDNDEAVHNLRLQVNTKLKAINPDMDLTTVMSKLDLDTAVTRINTAVAKRDHAQANRLLGEYKGVLGSSYDEMINHVEASRKNMMQEQGTQWAVDAFNAEAPADATWNHIATIKDPDMRQAASSQYSALWTMKSHIEEKGYQDSVMSVTAQLQNDFEVNDVAAKQAFVNTLPQETKAQTKTKQFAQAQVDAAKEGIGISKMSDAAAFMDIRSRILEGNLVTPEQVKTDPAAARVTIKDREELVTLLDKAQKASDKDIDTAFSESFGAKEWARIVKNQPDKAFRLTQQVKAKLKETNKSMDTGYIQSVTDTLSMSGAAKSTWHPGFEFSDKTLGEAMEAGGWSPKDLDHSLNTGSPLWLPTEIPDDFKREWKAGNIPSKKDWVRLYKSEKAMRAAYLRWMLQKEEGATSR